MKHKPSVSKEHPSQNPPVQFDVPADNSCLFWATTLAYLIPVKDDEDGFKQRYTALFGNEKIIHISHVRKLIQNYNPLLNEVLSNDILKNLVSDTFRNRVVDYIQSHEDEFRDYISDGFSEYLGNMRKPDTWGGQPEIMAMSEMLGAKVTVSGATKSEYDNGDFPIQLFHVSIIEEGELNHYRFGLPQNIIDTYRKNIPGQQSSAKTELIELLLTEPINPTSSVTESLVLLINREKLIGFAEKFGLFLEETPCIGSTSQEEFFIHAILGSVLTLPNSGLIKDLGIKNVYVKHDMKVDSVKGKKVVSSDIIKLCFVFEKGEKEQVALRVFANDKTEGYKNTENEYRYSDGELKEIMEKLGISNIDVDEHVFLICTEGDPGNKSFKLHKWKIDVVKERLKEESPPSQTDEFKKVETDESASLTDAFKKLSNKKVTEVMKGAKEIFLDFIAIHKKNKEEFSLFESEAAYHGFFYGALVLNFKYRYGLNCYVERAAGNGRADLTLISRTKDANGGIDPNPIQVIVEFKAGDHAVSEAIKQIKDKGYLYNLSMRTVAEDAVIVGVNPAQSDALQVEQGVIFQSRGFLRQLLEEVKNFNKNDVSEMQDNLKSELKKLYHSIPSHDQYYLSKVIFGQVLAVEADVKCIFIYKGEDESIGKKATTFVVFKQNAVILNIIEHTQKEPKFDPYVRTRNSEKQASEKQASVSKILPIHELGIDSAVKIDVKIRTGETRGVFEVEGNKYKSYYQDINIEEVSYIGCERKYSGEFKGIRNVDVGKLIQELKGKLTKPESKDQSSDSEDLSKTKSENQLSYSEDLPKTKSESELSYLSKILFNHKELISKERDFQAILQGLFMNGKDKNNREIRVYTESNISAKGKIDLMLSFVHLEIDGSLEEDSPIIIELKYADGLSKAKTELKKGEEQSDRKYTLIRSCTSKRTAYSLVMVFNKRAESPGRLIFVNIKGVNVEHTTSENVSSSESTNPTCEGQELYKFGSQAGSSSKDNSGLAPQVDFFDTEQELVSPDFQAGSPPSKRRKSTRSTESQRSVKPENYLDNVSAQAHSTQARDLGEM